VDSLYNKLYDKSTASRSGGVWAGYSGHRSNVYAVNDKDLTAVWLGLQNVSSTRSVSGKNLPNETMKAQL